MGPASGRRWRGLCATGNAASEPLTAPAGVPYAPPGKRRGIVEEDGSLDDLHEGAYGRASLAFIIIVMIGIVGPFALMAFGLWYGHGLRITW